MADASPVARSPIEPMPPEGVVAGWAVSRRRSGAAMTLTDETPLAKVAVRASPVGALSDVLGVHFGEALRRSWDDGGSSGGVLLVGSGPGEWLALAGPGQQSLVAGWLGRAAAGTDELVTVVDLTHGRALMRLTGARAVDVLAKECAADLTDAVCPDGSALRTAAAGVAVDIVRDDRDSVRSYLLHCERSSGQYLFDSLLDAGAEFGIDVDGFAPPAATSG